MTEKFFSIKPLDYPLHPGQKILKAEEYEQLLTYEQLLQRLEQRYQHREQAVASAMAKSVKRGFDQGQQQAAKIATEQMLMFNQRMQETLVQLEKELVDLVLSALRKVLRDLDREEQVRQAVLSGLELVRGSHKLVVRVNPQVQAAVAEQMDNTVHRFTSLEVVGDPQVSGTNCILESDIGIVNAGLDQQIKIIEQALRGAFSHSQSK